jgi:hypothetical protein
MRDSVTFIYPDGTITDEALDRVPEVGDRVGALVVARVETKGPDDEVDTGAWVYLSEADDRTVSKGTTRSG